jgi:hypothetical protein
MSYDANGRLETQTNRVASSLATPTTPMAGRISVETPDGQRSAMS